MFVNSSFGKTESHLLPPCGSYESANQELLALLHTWVTMGPKARSVCLFSTGNDTLTHLTEITHEYKIVVTDASSDSTAMRKVPISAYSSAIDSSLCELPRIFSLNPFSLFKMLEIYSVASSERTIR